MRLRRHPAFGASAASAPAPGNPKGDRVRPGMTGKFLPFKYYGAKGNEIGYGVKEE
jgi:hypothetical protein